MKFIDEWFAAIKTCFAKYIDISGRAKRAEYWYWFLFVVVVLVILAPMPTLYSLFSLAVIAPNITVGIRRLHDIGRSGTWMLISLIPIVGWLVLLYWFVQPSAQGQNEYDVSS